MESSDLLSCVALCLAFPILQKNNENSLPCVIVTQQEDCFFKISKDDYKEGMPTICGLKNQLVSVSLFVFSCSIDVFSFDSDKPANSTRLL